MLAHKSQLSEFESRGFLSGYRTKIFKLAVSLGVLAAFAFPTVVNAHPGGGRGHGGNGHGGAGHGPRSHHHGWGGWSWGVPWGWYVWDYPSSWSGGNAAAWQQGYYTAIEEVQSAALQQQAKLNRHQAQRKAAEVAAQPSPKRPVADQAPRSTPPIVISSAERAASKLKLAMLLADAGKTADAVEFCSDIVTKYPETPAAQQAQAFLKKTIGVAKATP